MLRVNTLDFDESLSFTGMGSKSNNLLMDLFLLNEEEIELMGIQGKALHTPGHTPGSMCFLFEKLKLLIAGDTLFKGSIGRTDLWGGDFQEIEKSIQEKLYTLDEDIAVITGHGDSTSIGREMRRNSFVRA